MTTTEHGVVRVWDLNDWVSYYGAPRKVDARIEEILMSDCPFYKGKLVKDTHFAFVGMPEINDEPLTVTKWLELHPYGQPMFFYRGDPWHAGQPHTDEAVLEPRLYIMLREIVPGSTGMTPEEQATMLPQEYEIPSTIAEVSKDMLVFRKTGKRCNGARCAMCSERTIETSQANAGFVSCVGFFGESGLSVDFWSGGPNSCYGVGASLKVPVD